VESNVVDLAEQIEAELAAAGTVERADKERAYLKSGLDHHGTPVPVIRSIARAALRRSPELRDDQIVELAETLWSDPVHERRMATVEVLAASVDRLGLGDATLLERLLRESHTWALVDPISTSVVGPLAAIDDGFGEVLDRWALDPDFWLRRAAMLSLLVPLRNGGGDFERFARYAESMLDEREFFIRKAIGWVLRDTSKRRPDMVFEWLLPRASRASGVTIREAVKHLPEDQRVRILAAR